MEENILGKVVEVEQEIRQRLETEKEKSAQWLATAREDAGREIVRTREALKGSLDAAIKEARAESDKKASEVIEEAKLFAEKLDGLESEELKKIILRHISTILPGD